MAAHSELTLACRVHLAAKRTMNKYGDMVGRHDGAMLQTKDWMAVGNLWLDVDGQDFSLSSRVG